MCIPGVKFFLLASELVLDLQNLNTEVLSDNSTKIGDLAGGGIVAKYGVVYLNQVTTCFLQRRDTDLCQHSLIDEEALKVGECLEVQSPIGELYVRVTTQIQVRNRISFTDERHVF